MWQCPIYLCCLSLTITFSFFTARFSSAIKFYKFLGYHIRSTFSHSSSKASINLTSSGRILRIYVARMSVSDLSLIPNASAFSSKAPRSITLMSSGRFWLMHFAWLSFNTQYIYLSNSLFDLGSFSTLIHFLYLVKG
jgi:hypothetical protein